MRLRFLGGAGTVTGSKHLIETPDGNVLVDCGLFQGLKELRLLNWEPPPLNTKRLKAVLLTHGHLDHCGYLPILVRHGFQGTIYCTAATAKIAAIILRDSARIHESDTEIANRMGFTKHQPARPLYTAEEAERAIRLFQPVPERRPVQALKKLSARFLPSGHILGSAWVQITTPKGRISFSGDLGREKPLLLRPSDPIEPTDILVLETTYGDRAHPKEDPSHVLADVINRTVARKGHLLIPAFAIGRTQDLIHLLAELRDQKRIPEVPIFLDSPMGIRATEVFTDFTEWHSLSSAQLARMESACQRVRNPTQSKELTRRRESTIVIAGSGMITGGRILQHLTTRLSDARNTVLLTGYQAVGTRGRLLQEGAPELKLLGQFVPVRAEVVTLSGLSGHADQGELLRWLRPLRKTPPRHTFLIHGEPQAAEALRVKIESEYGWSVSCTRMGETAEIKPSKETLPLRTTTKENRKASRKPSKPPSEPLRKRGDRKNPT